MPHIKLSDGNRIFYRESGERNANKILLIHGNSNSSASWQKLLQGNLSKTYHLIAPDMPGHGQSDNAPDPKGTYTTLGMGRALSLFMGALNIKDFNIMGHSLGGHIAIESWPDHLPAKKIMVFGSPPFSVPINLGELFLPNPLIPVVFAMGMNHQQATEIAASWLHSSESPDLRQFVEDLLRVDDKFRKRIGESLGAAEDLRDELRILSSIGKPICIAHAELDDWISGEYMKNLSVPMFRNKVQIIPGSGHTPQLENEESVTKLATEFFAS